MFYKTFGKNKPEKAKLFSFLMTARIKVAASVVLKRVTKFSVKYLQCIRRRQNDYTFLLLWVLMQSDFTNDV